MILKSKSLDWFKERNTSAFLPFVRIVLSEASIPSRASLAPGTLRLMNTIDNFKSADKKAAIEAEGRKVSLLAEMMGKDSDFRREKRRR